MLFALLFATHAVATPVVYRNPADGRAWEVALDAAEPLVWQWADGAVSATVTVSNVLSGATSATTVARGGGAAADGSCALPASGEAEQLLDVTLAQTDGTATVAEQTVRLKVGSSATVFVDEADKDFQAITEPRVYAWSDLWAEESMGAASATLATSVKNGAAIGNWTLPATGGYGAMSVKETFGGKRGPVTAALAFDGTTYLTAYLLAKALGFSIIFR
ncbi:MAG: hypothetical protein IJL17_20405 [Kiritimatiellae bacterium]|nr:hypothetical protein [Kiritimatiellia bacterium]